MSDTEATILSKFQEQLLLFIDQLREQFPRDGNLVCLRVFLETEGNAYNIIEIFTRELRINNTRKMIKERNEKFFTEYNMFDMFGSSNTNNFKTIWNLSDSDMKDAIWSWIGYFITIADNYVKVKKQSPSL